ncbi:hypothetical protein OUZ56_004464 [Daphnia magna]|uniref:Uncharacterized protein n=1 Tax=Daphnia magna TaxID=35525 RepID=A0ABQ9YPY9_9CRUS|nr:hypothetical protein OUZ56_004464 [Daphnia magna]
MSSIFIVKPMRKCNDTHYANESGVLFLICASHPPGEIIRVSWKDLEQEGREHIEKTAVLLGHDSHVQSDL